MACTRRSLLGLALSATALAVQADDDDLLYDRVHRRLNNDRSLKIKQLEVEVDGGVVTIRGLVRSAKLKAKATKIASIKGVRKVVNRLEIGN